MPAKKAGKDMEDFRVGESQEIGDCTTLSKNYDLNSLKITL